MRITDEGVAFYTEDKGGDNNAAKLLALDLQDEKKKTSQLRAQLKERDAELKATKEFGLHIVTLHAKELAELDVKTERKDAEIERWKDVILGHMECYCNFPQTVKCDRCLAAPTPAPPKED